MFEGATSFDQEISDWNVSNVYYMNYMFKNAITFNRSLYYWTLNYNFDIDIGNITNINDVNVEDISYTKNNNVVIDMFLGATSVEYLILNGILIDDTNVYQLVEVMTDYENTILTVVNIESWELHVLQI